MRELFESQLNTCFSEISGRGNLKPLSNLIDISHGYSFKGPDFSKSMDDALPIVLTPGNYTEDAKLSFTSSNTKRLRTIPPRGFLFENGDLTVVMTDLSSKMKILGKPAFIEQSNILHNQRIGRIIYKAADLNARYLYYFLRTKKVLDHIRATATGTMVRHTAPIRILATQIPYPFALGDQQQIVDVLDAMALSTEQMTDKFSSKLHSLDRLKSALLAQAFSGHLGTDGSLAEAAE